MPGEPVRPVAELEIEIDGAKALARPGETILQAARRAGLGDGIQTLCHLEGLVPHTSCYVCVVEEQGRGKLLPACSTPVSQGLKVLTGSPKVQEARKTALELLLSDHPADCRAPCSLGCPAVIDVQKYLALAMQGRCLEAVKVIRQRNPLPLVCGRICVRKCEEHCRRALIDSPISINAVKRLISQKWFEGPGYTVQPEPPSGKTVALIGAGPSGLTAAWFLALSGHKVTIFERREKAGGMLRYGIPDYRLPQHLLEFEIDRILELGVGLRCGVSVGKDVTMEQLCGQFDAVYLSVGAQKGSAACADGEAGPGVMSGVDFLAAVKLGTGPDLKGKKVLVLGGGNTAVDTARTAVRLGALHVTMLYRRTRKEMPADPAEIVAAEEEGVRIEYLVAPLRPERGPAGLTGLLVQTMTLGEPGPDGRRKPVPVPDSEHVIRTDFVIGATGQQTDLSGLAGQLGVERWGGVKAASDTLFAGAEKVFAGGDVVLGPSTVIEAIGHGRQAALAMDLFLKTGTVQRPAAEFVQKKEAFGEIERGEYPDAVPGGRLTLQSLPPEQRAGFVEVEQNPAPEEVRLETKRCLQCGCAARDYCDLRELAAANGLEGPVGGATRKRRRDDSHPLIVYEPDKCVKCARCVRICGELLGINVFGLVDRGFDTMVAPALLKKLGDTHCISCGNCVDACPTGALSFKDRACSDAAMVEEAGTCGLCTELCDIRCVQNESGHSVRPAQAPGYLGTQLCRTGRLAPALARELAVSSFVVHEGRKDVVLAGEAMLAGLAAMQKARQAGGKTLVCVGGSLPLEDLETAVWFGREYLGARVCSLEWLTGHVAPGALATPLVPRAALGDAGALLILGAGAMPDRPSARAELRQLQERGVIPLLFSGQVPGWLRQPFVQVEAGPGGIARELDTLSGILNGAEAVQGQNQPLVRVAEILKQASGPWLGLANLADTASWQAADLEALDRLLSGSAAAGRGLLHLASAVPAAELLRQRFVLTKDRDLLEALKTGGVDCVWTIGETFGPAALPRPAKLIHLGAGSAREGVEADIHISYTDYFFAPGTRPDRRGKTVARKALPGETCQSLAGLLREAGIDVPAGAGPTGACR